MRRLSGGSTIAETHADGGNSGDGDPRDETNHLGIVVFIAGTSYSAMTAANGAYTMSFVPVAKVTRLWPARWGMTRRSRRRTSLLAGRRRSSPSSLHRTSPLRPRDRCPVVAHLEGAATNAGVFVYLAGTSHISVTDDAGSFNLTGVASRKLHPCREQGRLLGRFALGERRGRERLGCRRAHSDPPGPVLRGIQRQRGRGRECPD